MSNYKNCPNCENIGFSVYPDFVTGEPEQEQCQFCYEEPDSVFNVITKLQAENQALRNELEALRGDALRLGKLIENGLVCSVCGGGGFIGNPPDDYQDCPECKKSINKIKIHAVLCFANEMDSFENNPSGVNDRTVRLAKEYANKLEQDND